MQRMNFGRPSTPGAEGAARARQNDRVHLFVDREVKRSPACLDDRPGFVFLL
jgi:hypothetical protein